MRTPLFIEDKKVWADIPSALSNPEQNVMNILRADASGAGALLVHQQTTPNMTLFVQPANNVYINGSNINFAGGSTPTFSAPSTGTRTDLVTIDNLGTIKIYQGISGPSNYPSTERALAEVLLISGDTSIEDSRITDVRQFFGAGLSPNATVTTNKIGTQADDYPTNTIFSISSGSYIVGSGATQVYVDGIRKILGKDYTENSSTTITLVEPLLDTQDITIITNQLNAFDLSQKVSKSGDTMTGLLTLPELNLDSSDIRIYYSGGNLILEDSVVGPKTLSALSGGSVVGIPVHSEQTASSGQTVFTVPTYPTGTNQLQVYVNGLLQRITTHYVETNSTTVTFTSGLVAGALVTFHAVI